MVATRGVEGATLRGDVTVIIPVFGPPEPWLPLADRALSSVLHQTVRPSHVVVSAADSLREARNHPAMRATTEWLCFLDADDELDPHYVEAMAAGQGDLLQPSTLGIVDGVEDDYPVLIPPRPLQIANYIVIGAFVRTSVFQSVGGFDDFVAFEDWDLWRRCYRAGAEIGAVPDAIYRVHVRPGSRNSTMTPAAMQAYEAIRRRPL